MAALPSIRGHEAMTQAFKNVRDTAPTSSPHVHQAAGLVVDCRSTESHNNWTRPSHAVLATGAGRYVADISRPDETWMHLVRSPVAHGRIQRIACDEAVRLPGVLAVITARDLPAGARIPLRNRAKPELERYLQPILGEDELRYVGEPVVAIVAESRRIAEDAADLVELDIDPLPVALDVDSSQANTVWQHGDVMARVNGGYGDFARIASIADHVITEQFETARDSGLPLETRGLIADWNDDSATLDLWGPTKYVAFTQRTVASWFGLDVPQVVCHRADVGGMFGVRGELYPEDYLVPFCAIRLRRPVKWIEDRNEHMVAINHSRGQRHTVTIAADSSGRLLGIKVDARIDMGAYARPIGAHVAEAVIETIAGPYRWEAVEAACRAVATNKTPMGTMRGPSTFDTTFARERMIDLLAAAIDDDPIAVRERNLITAAEMPFTQPMGPQVHEIVYDTGNYPETLATLLREVDYPRLAREVAQRRGTGELVGLGVGCFVVPSGLGAEESVEVEIMPAGNAFVRTTGSDFGQGLEEMARRIASEELSIPPSSVSVEANQTSAFNGGSGTFGSRGAIFLGSAIRDACRQLRSRTDLPPTEASGQRAVAVGKHVSSRPTFGFATHLAVVSVDPGTLDIEVERLAVICDTGRTIDKESVRGQLEGATIQGLGGVLYQAFRYDDTGQPLCTTLMDFAVPVASEVCDVEVFVTEFPDYVSNPLGVKGAGEAGIMGVGAAVGNAVSAALRDPRTVRHLPIAPDDLIAVIGQTPMREEPAAPAVQRRPLRRAPIATAGAAALLVAIGWVIARRCRTTTTLREGNRMRRPPA